MGLDMYLHKAKRIDGANVEEILNINNYLEYEADKVAGKTENYTAKEWNGCDEDELDMELVDKYRSEFIKRYAVWDTKKEYGWDTIIQTVLYWRKANAIHNWFVENIQDNNDDCRDYEVTKRKLKELLDICIEVRDNCKLVKGKVKNGQIIENGEWVDIYEDGEYIENPSVAQELLPCSSGFFFGSTEYDQWYLDDINDTIEGITRILKETDFNNEVIIYGSSW